MSTKTLKIANKEKIFGYTEKMMDNFIINMVILNTRIVVHKKRQDGSIMNGYQCPAFII